jgi:hypothetical protein
VAFLSGKKALCYKSPSKLKARERAAQRQKLHVAEKPRHLAFMSSLSDRRAAERPCALELHAQTHGTSTKTALSPAEPLKQTTPDLTFLPPP